MKIKDPGYNPSAIIRTLKEELMADENNIDDVKDDICKYFNRYLELIAARLMNNEPFYGQFLIRTTRIIDLEFYHPAGVTLLNSNLVMKLNPLFLMNFTSKQIEAIIIHEFLHLIHFHLKRSTTYKTMNRELQFVENIAMDCAINQYLPNIPKGAVTLESVKEMVNTDSEKKINLDSKREYEYYFKVLKENKKIKKRIDDYDKFMDKLKEALKNAMQQGNGGNNNSNNGSKEDDNNQGDGNNQNSGKTMGDLKKKLTSNSGWGDCHESWDQSNTLDEKDMNMAINNIVNSVLSSCQKGDIPGYVMELINKLNKKPMIPWQKELRNMIGSIRVPYIKTLRKRSRRLPERLDIAGKKLDSILNIAIAIDTSGSMSNRDLEYVFNEVFGILKVNNKFKLTVIECDAEIGKIYTATNQNEVNLKVTGRGGTSFLPVFKWLYELKSSKKPDILIYFTDGYGDYNIDAKYKPTKSKLMWVINGNSEHPNLSLKDPFTKKIKPLYVPSD